MALPRSVVLASTSEQVDALRVTEAAPAKKERKGNAKGASSVSSGIRLEGVTKVCCELDSSRVPLRCRAVLALRRDAESAACRARQQTFKGLELLKGVSWEVKKGDRVGLVGASPWPA